MRNSLVDTGVVCLYIAVLVLSLNMSLLENLQFDIEGVPETELPEKMLAAENTDTRDAISGFISFPQIDEVLQRTTIEDILSKYQSPSTKIPGEVNF
ncbi:MAG: hypothetical protein A2V81_05155 [Candidatus Abawacabacteria bacterium RBG_16_42_10]|uniref:Uncharacterized protein n=1 Tax=Candidatus Abawacabacteria bacterium RBG_16_42_10 TaxID=1817814 RepID=A0A1F4XJ39_9BACT|nr:MAG: hypothetical protein A2V81_05155 [Candidatus Abawacabacteria bacterium RBG_16_42_10]